MNKLICSNLAVDGNGVLIFGGRSTVDLIKKYGSPIYVTDESRIRYNMRLYADAMKRYFGAGAVPLFAGKAASFKRIYEIAAEEDIGTDVVSSGEIYTAVSAGFPMDKAYFHGNNKTDFDITFAMDNKVGYFVVDNDEELDAIGREAEKRGIVQKILIRLTPGIDPHTYEAVSTGKADSKFGAVIENGAAEKITVSAINKKNVKLCGFHCHVGSQVFDSDVHLAAAYIMMKFMADMKKKYSFVTEELNLGGGYGVRYTNNDPIMDIEENIRLVAEETKRIAKKFGIDYPLIRTEPGRSIVADAGMTLYTVGSVKVIPEYKNYVSVDGGMTDNPRFALYGSEYTLIAANKANEKCDFNCSVVGRCCESGDIIQENVSLPSSIKRGDIIAVLTTGAYNYSMSSNYNRIPRPPIIMVNGDSDYVAVKRESFEDMTKNDV